MITHKVQILYPKGVISALAADFSVTPATVRNALRFSTVGEQPDLIREKAIKDYNCVISNVPLKYNKKK